MWRDNVLKATDICIKKRILITEEVYENSSFHPQNDRLMDVLTRKVLYTAHMLLKEVKPFKAPQKTGAVISTQDGPVNSLKEIADYIRTGEYRQINPGRFPHVMLSTALSYLTANLKIYGPCSAFYCKDNQQKDVLEYCYTQLLLENCNEMVYIHVNEQKNAEGMLFSRKE